MESYVMMDHTREMWQQICTFHLEDSLLDHLRTGLTMHMHLEHHSEHRGL